MPLFSKDIIPEGEHLVTLPGGRRTLKSFSGDYLKEVVKNFNLMKRAGLRVPAPFRHAKDAVPIEGTPETDSFDNAGYWDSLTTKTNDDGKVVLCGVVDSPGTEDDMETPAGKLKHRVKEVSACLVDAWTDGTNHNWGPSMLHGAPVVNPVIPNQEEFQLMSLPDDSFLLSESGLVLEQTPTSDSLAELSRVLEDAIGVYLPPGTLLQDLPKMLMVSLKQYKLCSETQNDDQEIVDTQSIFMSLPEGQTMPLSKEAMTELIELGVTNPKTGQKFVEEDFDVQDPTPTPAPVADPGQSEIERHNLALTAELTESKKDGLRRRVESCIARGQATQEHIDKHVTPKIETYELAIGTDGKYQPNVVDELITAIEALPFDKKKVPPNAAQLAGELPPGMTVNYDTEMEGEGAGPEYSDEQRGEMKKQLLGVMANV